MTTLTHLHRLADRAIELADDYEGGYRHYLRPDGTIAREKQKGFKGHMKRHWKKYAIGATMVAAPAIVDAASLHAQLDTILLERTRDPAGQFAPQQPPGMDAMTMRTAYNAQNNSHRPSTAAKVAKTVAAGVGLAGAYAVGRKRGAWSGYSKGARTVLKRARNAAKETDGFARKVSESLKDKFNRTAGQGG